MVGGDLPIWNIWKSVGMIIPNGKIEDMFQTTNQFISWKITMLLMGKSTISTGPFRHFQ